MNSRQTKILLASVISFVLIYYSAAWAILQCFHGENHSGEDEIAISATARDAAPHAHVSLPGGESESVDCKDFDYHMEFLGGPTAPPELHRSPLSSSVHAHELVSSGNSSEGWAPNSIVNFTRGSPDSTPADTPLFLFFSSLRI